MNTKIFCDIADIIQIKKFNKKKIVKGFTTNPSLMRKAGAKNYEAYSKKILKVYCYLIRLNKFFWKNLNTLSIITEKNKVDIIE